ncbi:hypothetical protein EDB84DRAFT_1470756 [Lactarius hengduanensis]|nr:hypothetical protein EDB84DRAFT_1470756 [Lactarius hengduanensis]
MTLLSSKFGTKPALSRRRVRLTCYLTFRAEQQIKKIDSTKRNYLTGITKLLDVNNAGTCTASQF